ncbi:hypothetical protein B0O80DRAFT_493584 [Mortierella sp. GBAus27b]|nr:hypothetical protein B0O80DRAFT_493584 [Mortierella sp. GBAus27b]
MEPQDSDMEAGIQYDHTASAIFEDRGPLEQPLTFEHLFPELDLDGPTRLVDYAALLGHHDQTDFMSPNNVEKPRPKELPREILSEWLELSLSCSLFNTPRSTMTYGGTQYLACIISPSVASLVTVNVIDSVNKICGQLPFQILPDELDCATLSYKVVLPQDSMYSTLRILVSWPTMLDSRQGNHITGPTASDVELLDPDSLILVERVSTSIRTYLESTLQLISMGLSDHPRSRGQRQDDIRDLEQRLHQARIDVKNRTHRIEYLKAAMKEAEILDRRRSSVETFYESIGRHDSVQSRDLNAGNKGLSKAVVREELSTERSLLEMSARRIQEFEKKLKSLRCSDPWISDYTVKDKELVSMPPLCPPITYYTATGRDILSSAPTTCSFDRLRGTHAGLHCVSTRHAPTTNTSMPCVASSDNVPLSLDSDVEHLGELCLYFRPSLLEARFERWVQTYEPEQRDHIDDEFDEHLADAEDLLLLEAESDYLHSTRLDVDDYESLCRKHRLSLPGSTREVATNQGKYLHIVTLTFNLRICASLTRAPFYSFVS